MSSYPLVDLAPGVANSQQLEKRVQELLRKFTPNNIPAANAAIDELAEHNKPLALDYQLFLCICRAETGEVTPELIQGFKETYKWYRAFNTTRPAAYATRFYHRCAEKNPLLAQQFAEEFPYLGV